MESTLAFVISKLEVRIKKALIAASAKYERINEIRIRDGSELYITAGIENIPCGIIVDKEMITKTFDSLCSGTLHSHLDTIRQGYISLADGVRVGVVGKSLVENESIRNVYDITALNIRIPYPIYGICDRVYEKIRESAYYLNVLIYSTPGAGKTTMIRDLCVKLAKEGNRRVALIDSRCEMSDQVIRKCGNIDIYSAYPKALAMEYAIRTMNPQYIICDEIGSGADSLALIASQSAGVPVIATAHARNIIELMRRSNIRTLHENGVFDLYVGIRRSQQNKIIFSFCGYDEVSL